MPVCVCVCVEETRGLAVKDHPPASPFLFCFSSYFFKTGAESRKQEKKEKNPTGPSTHLKNNIGDEQREHTQTHTPPPLPAQKKGQPDQEDEEEPDAVTTTRLLFYLVFQRQRWFCFFPTLSL